MANFDAARDKNFFEMTFSFQSIIKKIGLNEPPFKQIWNTLTHLKTFSTHQKYIIRSIQVYTSAAHNQDNVLMMHS